MALVRAPRRIKSTVLLAPVPASGAKIGDARRTLLLRAIADPDARRALIDANTGGARSAAWIEQLAQLSLATTRADALEAYMNSWTHTDFSGEVQDVEVPVQVIVGELDPGAPLERMEKTIMKWYASAKIQTLPGIGHYPMQECPRELRELIAEHFTPFSENSSPEQRTND